MTRERISSLMDNESDCNKGGCASHAGVEVHNAGLLLISRFIGKRQVVSVQNILDKGFKAEKLSLA